MDDVDRLLSLLKDNLQDSTLSNTQQEDLLVKLKVLGRNVEVAGPIFTQNGISILSRYGFDQSSSNSSREALRCLANALLLNEPSRQTFVDLGYAKKAAERLKSKSADDEFLVSRIIFLLTYTTNVDLEVLIVKHQLAETVNDCISRHSERYGAGPTSVHTTQMEEMALTETLKLIFNIIYFAPKLAKYFVASLKPISNMILCYPLPTPPLQPPIGPMLNTLLNLDLSIPDENQPQSATSSLLSTVFPPDAADALVERLITIFDRATLSYQEDDLEQAAATICTILRRFYSLAPPAVKSFMQSQILPSEDDRDKPLGRGTSFPNRLLKLSSSPKLPLLKENISNLLFELSDKDPNLFVQNIGYGHASGYLMSHNLQVSPVTSGASSDTVRAGPETSIPINPITGQRLDSEARDAPSTAQMTDEEKEREAERLFVLFERLKATGVMDVKNPVQQAMEDGRFEELD